MTVGRVIRQPSRAPAARAALSLIEVMIAIAVLAIGVSSVFSHYAALYSLRATSKATGQLQDVLRTVFERIVAADGQVLNMKTPDGQEYALLWSRARYEDDVSGDGPPMTEADLLNPAFGPLLVEPVGIPDLRVYVEYYRAERDDNGTETFRDDDLPGMLGPAFDKDPIIFKAMNPASVDDPGEFTARMSKSAARAACRLNPAWPAIEQVRDNACVLIRVLVVAEGVRAELYTAKRNVPVIER